MLTLYLARNPGAAFSTGTSYTLVLTCVALAAAVAVLWTVRRLRSTGWAIGLGFLMAGVLGNLTDRIFRSPGVLRGHVVDFLQLPNWPIFNVADVCINIAAGVIILQAVRGISVNGTRSRGATPTTRRRRRDGRPTSTGHERRTVTVPDGLAGERVDAAIARMFGLSRTRAAELILSGHVSVDGAPPAKSDRVEPGSMLDVAIPAVVDPVAVVPETVEGIKIIHDDDAIVVIDKPVGVAVHPSPGWTGPTVVGHLVAAGFRISTSGAAERQGIVQRLDVGTSGVMVIAKSERAYSVLKNAFRTGRSTRPTTRSSRGTRTRCRAPWTRRSRRHPKHDYKFTVRADGKREHHPLRDARGAPLRDPARGAPRDRSHAPDPRAHGGPQAPLRRRPHLRRRPDAGQAGRARPAVAARRTPRLRAPRVRRVGRVRVGLPRRPPARPGHPPRCRLSRT